MPNYRFVIQYDGARYSGWQKQGNTEKTVQEKLETLLTRMDGGHRVIVDGSGRTDAGVHALGQVANAHLLTDFDCAELVRDMNRYLPEDIKIVSAEIVDPRFHSRLNAKRKTYRYRLWPDDEKPDVFIRRYVAEVPADLDTDAMERALKLLEGRHDFFAFCANRRYKKSTERTLYSCTLHRNGHEIDIDITGSGFLYGMVRILAGTIVEVGRGLRKPEDIPAILDSRDREQAGVMMPAEGLVLLRVEYPEE